MSGAIDRAEVRRRVNEQYEKSDDPYDEDNFWRK